MATSGTPATVALARAGVTFAVHAFDHEGATRDYGRQAAEALGVDEGRVFKTLLARVDGRPVVGIVPVSGQLGLKELAVALGGKRAELLPPDDAQRLTGYVVGGISPFGQKRRLPTVLDASAEQLPTIFVSGGRRGLDVEVSPADLTAVLDAVVAPIATTR